MRITPNIRPIKSLVTHQISLKKPLQKLAETTSSQPIDKLVLVVHGVGDPRPGSTVTGLARALADSNHPLIHQQQTIWLREPTDDPTWLQTFPTYGCQLRRGDKRIELAEVYWGDLSRVFHGFLGVVLGIFQVLFGLRYVAYAAADQPGFFAYWLKRFGRYSERILQGPVLAVAFCLVLFSLFVCLNHFVWKDSIATGRWVAIPFTACCGIALAASVIGGNLAYNRVTERFWFWVNINICFIAGVHLVRLLVLNPFFGGGSLPAWGLLWYCQLQICFLAVFWSIQICLLACMGVCWCGATLDRRVHRPAINVAMLLPALSIGMWSFALLLFWLIAADRIQHVLGVEGFQDLFAAAVPLLGVQFVMSAIIGLSVAVSAARYLNWRRVKQVSDFEWGARPPRLIVGGEVQLTIALATALGATLVLTTQILNAVGFNYHSFWYGRLLAECNKYALPMLLPIGLLVSMLIPKLRPIFGIVLEVVNHFVFRSTASATDFDYEDQFDMSETTFEKGTMQFWKREIISGRIKQILRHYAARFDKEHPPELIIVSHSQGTVISIEALNDPELDCLHQFSRVTLVTMGSPFTNLYQHYFPHYYPPLDSAYWNPLQARVNHWVNIYRIDDPVGTEIVFPESYLINGTKENDRWQPKGSHNFSLGCRGHGHYWNDREVLGLLRSEVFRDDWEAIQSYRVPMRQAG